MLYIVLQVTYETALREAKRALDEHAEKIQQQTVTAEKHNSLAARAGVLLGRVSAELTKECERQGAWGVVGKGTGARLMQNGQVLNRNQIIGEYVYSDSVRFADCGFLLVTNERYFKAAESDCEVKNYD